MRNICYGDCTAFENRCAASVMQIASVFIKRNLCRGSNADMEEMESFYDKHI